MLLSIARVLRTVSLGIWLGGLVFLFILAPVVFSTLAPDTTASGKVVGNTLRVLGQVKLGLIAVAVLAEVLATYHAFAIGSETRSGWNRALLRGGLLLACVTTALAMLWVEPSIHELRSKIGDFNTMAKDHPDRVAFGKWHGLSMVLTLLEVIFVLIALVAAAL